MKVSGRNGGFWRRAAAAVQPAAALKTRVRNPFGEPKRNTRRTCGSRRPAVPVTGGTAAGVLCLVPRFCVLDSVDRGKKKIRERDTPPIHRHYRWWRGMLKGAVAGTSPTGPWTDGRAGARTPDDDERHPWRIPLDRPCLLPNMTQITYKTNRTSIGGSSVTNLYHRGRGSGKDFSAHVAGCRGRRFVAPAGAFADRSGKTAPGATGPAYVCFLSSLGPASCAGHRESDQDYSCGGRGPTAQPLHVMRVCHHRCT